MRVLIMGANYAPEPSGIAPYTAALATGLRDRGHDVEVVTARPHYPEWRVPEGYDQWTRRERIDGISVTRVRHYVPRRPRLARRLLSEATLGARLLAHGGAGAEVVLLVSPALISVAVAMAGLGRGNSRAGVGVIVQDLYSSGLSERSGFSARLAGGMAALEGRTLRSADRVAVIHDRFKRRVVEELGVGRERVDVIRNWTHVAAAAPFDRGTARRELGWRDDDFVVLHTGAMGDKQDLHNVVDAARLADRRSSSVRFVLTGAGGQRDRLVDAGRGVDRLEFREPVASSSYPQLLASADVLLVNERPGLAESAVPSKLTSYFSSGVPILAVTDPESTTADEVLASGAGVRIDPGDPELLLDSLQTLAADADRRRRLGERGPVYAARTTSETLALDAYDQFVRRVATHRN